MDDVTAGESVSNNKQESEGNQISLQGRMSVGCGGRECELGGWSEGGKEENSGEGGRRKQGWQLQ